MKFLIAVFLGLGLSANLAAEKAKQSKAEEKPATQEQKASTETRQTPFGPARAKKPEEIPQPAETRPAEDFVEVEEKGDLIVFTKKTPFGPQIWKKKRSELSDSERELVARKGKQADPKQPAPVSKPAAAEVDAKPSPR